MSTIKAGEIADTISELRSKLRVYEALSDQIRANYLPSDGGAAELRLERADGASVTQAHMESVLAEFEGRLEEIREELEEWEGLTFHAGGSEDQAEDEDEEAPEPAKAGSKSAKQPVKVQGKKNVGTNLRSVGSHPPATK